ncbi:MAG: PHP domain-containing protein, partial [Alphaproteobacteria bacterium]|nr:PHP domain-containing protein [Alphaproteobacteria bacterium]
MTIAPFVHLRNHTAYSVAEGALTSDKIRDLCRKYNMPAAGITDTNNIFGGAEFSTHLEEVGVQPILGTQLDVDFDLPTSTFPKNRYSQLIFLVKDSVGYHNLIKLISYSHLRKKDEEFPHITLDMLEGKTDGLIVLSGGIKGVLGKCLLANNYALAEEKCLLLKKLFGDRFYIECLSSVRLKYCIRTQCLGSVRTSNNRFLWRLGGRGVVALCP